MSHNNTVVRILVKTDDAKSFVISASSSDSILNVRNKLETQYGRSIRDRDIYFDGMAQPDDRLVGELNLGHQSFLYVGASTQANSSSSNSNELPRSDSNSSLKRWNTSPALFKSTNNPTTTAAASSPSTIMSNHTSSVHSMSGHMSSPVTSSPYVANAMTNNMSYIPSGYAYASPAAVASPMMPVVSNYASPMMPVNMMNQSMMPMGIPPMNMNNNITNNNNNNNHNMYSTPTRAPPISPRRPSQISNPFDELEQEVREKEMQKEHDKKHRATTSWGGSDHMDHAPHINRNLSTYTQSSPAPLHPHTFATPHPHAHSHVHTTPTHTQHVSMDPNLVHNNTPNAVPFLPQNTNQVIVRLREIEAEIVRLRAHVHVAQQNHGIVEKVDHITAQISKEIANREVQVANAKAEQLLVKNKLDELEQKLREEEEKTAAAVNEVVMTQKNYENKISAINSKLKFTETDRHRQIDHAQQHLQQLKKELGTLSSHHDVSRETETQRYENLLLEICDLVWTNGLVLDVEQKLNHFRQTRGIAPRHAHSIALRRDSTIHLTLDNELASQVGHMMLNHDQ